MARATDVTEGAGAGVKAASRDTRGEILAVASELFIEQGYDATSLREIAERLGVTKAALYYHFPGKDDIMLALMEPVREITGELVNRLEAARDIAEWADTLSWVVQVFYEHIDFFRLLERNRHSLAQIHETFDQVSEHFEMHERIRVAVHAIASDVSEEVRLFAALATVTGFDDWAPRLIAEAPPEIIQTELAAAVRAILGLPKRRAVRGAKAL